MLTRSKAAAIQEIRRWNVEDVLTALEKNGLGDCADVIKKREVVGDMLLQLTEGKLALWKRDINQSKIRALAAFVDDLQLHPEKYLLKENCADEPDHCPARGLLPSRVPSIPFGSETMSWPGSTNAEDDKEQRRKAAATICSALTSKPALADSLALHEVKPPDKPPLLTRPKAVPAGAINKAPVKIRVLPPNPPTGVTSDHRHLPAGSMKSNNVSPVSSRNVSPLRDANSEDEKEQKGKGSTSSSLVAAVGDSSHADLSPPNGLKPVKKPALLQRPKDLQSIAASRMQEKKFLPKPLCPMSCELKNFPARNVSPSCVALGGSTDDAVFHDAISENGKEEESQGAATGTGKVAGSHHKDALRPVGLKLPSRNQNEIKSDPGHMTHENDHEHVPKPPNPPASLFTHFRSVSSGSDTASWDTDFEDCESPKEPASVPEGSTSLCDKSGDSIHTEEGQAPSDKLPPSNQPKNMQDDGTSPLYDKIPMPPIQLSNILSTVNISAIEAKILNDELDEEFYESFDGENIADLIALRAAAMHQNSEQKSDKGDAFLINSKQMGNHVGEPNIQNGIPCPDSLSNVCQNQPPKVTDSDQRKNSDAFPPESPPTPPPRNATMKLEETDAVINRLHSSTSSLQEGSMHRRKTSDQLQMKSGIATSHHSLMSLSSPNIPPANVSYLHSLRNSQVLPESNEGEYETLDIRSYIKSVGSDSANSEVYASIEEQDPMKIGDEDAYYLQPDPKLSSLLRKSDESLSDDSQNLSQLPIRSKTSSLPDVVLPSAPPPSPPRKKSEDSSSSTTSGSGDSMSGRIGGLFRKVISRQDFSEKTPSSTPELKKPCSLPPPTTKPPPPVEQSPFHRPLPPTPDRTHNPIVQQTSQISPTSYRQMPWFHNINRQRAEELLRNSGDGVFVVRPSSQSSNPLTLTLWYKNRFFHINIRHRQDGKYALGTEKANEQSFNSIEEMVDNYKSERLVLYSAGSREGKVLLTNSPRRTS